MHSNQKTGKFLCAAMAVSVLLTGCATTNTDSSLSTSSLTESAAEETTSASAVEEAVTNVSNLSMKADVPYSVDPASLFTERDLRLDYEETAVISLEGDTASVSGEGVSVDGAAVTITAEGTYLIQGTLDDGQIIVDADGAKVQLVLDNANITSNTAAPIVVRNAKKVFLTLAEGTENTVTSFAAIDETAEDAENAVIYSKDDLTINGKGSLLVTDKGTGMNGIVSKDALVITGGGITVNTSGNGIKGKDSIAIADGSMTVNADGDGLKASNDTDEGMGFVYICGGTITIDAGEDGIQAETELIVEGGTLDVISGGGSANAEPHTEDFGMGGGMPGGNMGGFGGKGNWDSENADGNFPNHGDWDSENSDGNFGGRGGFGRKGGWEQNQAETGTVPTAYVTAEATVSEDTAEDTSVSVKGLKAGTLLYIGAGEVTVDAADDALHSNQDLYLTGGTVTLTAGSKGIHADSLAEISGGTLVIEESYEGIEAADINVSGGELTVNSSDDGFNASDGSQQGAMGGVVDASLTISGGNVYVNAGGDGLDSNGELLVSGGTVIVDGSTNSGNGALDSNSSLTCTGGLLVAVGASGMAEYPTGTQETIVLTTTETQAADTEVTITDADGNTVFTYTPSKTWNSFIISSSDLKSGETYSFTLNGEDAGTVTMDDAVCYIGEAGGMMGGGMMGGHGGGMQPGNADGDLPEDFQPGNFDPSQFGDGDFDPSQFADGDFDPSQMQPPTDADGNQIQPGGPMGYPGGDGSVQQQSFNRFDPSDREMTAG